jgi:putative ABC transport system permease protein
MSRSRMFLRMLLRPLIVRRGSSAIAVLAIVVAATAATAMLTLFADVQAKLRGEFRNYGANLIVTARSGETLPLDALQKIESQLHGSASAAPFGYVVARVEGQSVVVAGIDVERTKKVDPFWLASAWPESGAAALVGSRASKQFGKGELELEFQGHKLRVRPTGVLRTGGAEDSRIYIALSDFTAWTGLTANTIEVAASGRPEEMQETSKRITFALPGAEVTPIKQIADAEANVFGKTRSTLLVAVVIIVITAALCLLATLTSSVLDRRKDFAVMKALGASPGSSSLLFAVEAALLGASGSVLGFILGIAVAFLIGRINFHSVVLPHWTIFPTVILGGIALSVFAALLPMGLLSRMQPAVILKGE